VAGRDWQEEQRQQERLNHRHRFPRRI
jgi:hypothetical protein